VKRSWKNELSETEIAESGKLITKIRNLRENTDLHTFGLQIVSFFLRRQIQPLQARLHDMWKYSGTSNPNRLWKEDPSSKELKGNIAGFSLPRVVLEELHMEGVDST
jgi:hypothetical protein